MRLRRISRQATMKSAASEVERTTSYDAGIVVRAPELLVGGARRGNRHAPFLVGAQRRADRRPGGRGL
jgi:hypothetical protein